MRKTKSSKRWLKEHEQDEYVKMARKEGYRSRAVYKLIELDQHDKLLKAGMKVVDLGAAPGGWAEIVAKKVGEKGQVFALDILPMAPIPGVIVIQGDFEDEAILSELHEIVGDQKIDLVLSDMSPNISGIAAVDIPKAMYLAELSLEFARQVLGTGGSFVVKVFQGEGFDAYFKTLKRLFKKVNTRKPKASRPRSREVYLVAKGFKEETIH